jgi:hypothetical protein
VCVCVACLPLFAYTFNESEAMLLKWQAGKYKDVPGDAECTACPDNSNSEVGSTECQCNTGFGGVFTACESCAPGKYATADGCTDCAAGTYSSAPGSTDCTPCGVGNYSTTIAATNYSFCLACESGKFSMTSTTSACLDCVAGKYSSVSGLSACLDCAADTYSTSLGLTDAGECSNCTDNSNTAGLTGQSAASACICNTGFAPSGEACALSAAVTSASMTHTSMMRSTEEPAYNILTAVFTANVDLPTGTPITITNLTGTETASGIIPLIGTLDERLTFSEGSGTWDKALGELQLRLAVAKSAGDTISFSFEVQNPSSGQEAPTPVLSTTPPGLPALTRKVSGTALLVCGENLFGKTCSKVCMATATAAVEGGELGGVKGTLDLFCLCGQYQFGSDCNITLAPPVETPMNVTPGVPLTADIPGGGKLKAPAGADFGGRTVKAAVFEFTPSLPMPEGQEEIEIAGAMMQMEPTPHVFCANTTCTSDCAPTLCKRPPSNAKMAMIPKKILSHSLQSKFISALSSASRPLLLVLLSLAILYLLLTSLSSRAQVWHWQSNRQVERRLLSTRRTPRRVCGTNLEGLQMATRCAC